MLSMNTAQLFEVPTVMTWKWAPKWTIFNPVKGLDIREIYIYNCYVCFRDSARGGINHILKICINLTKDSSFYTNWGNSEKYACETQMITIPDTLLWAQYEAVSAWGPRFFLTVNKTPHTLWIKANPDILVTKYRLHTQLSIHVWHI